MIGLKRHTVEVVEHDPEWSRLATDVCQAIRTAGAGHLLDVQHIGSTAVPSLPAKPILDIAASVENLDSVSDLIPLLAAIGFTYKGERTQAGDHLFVIDLPPDIRTTHLHIVRHASTHWRDYLAFRDLLRSDTAVRCQYAESKRRLAVAHAQDREAYTEAKAAFIRTALNGLWEKTR